MAERIRDVEAYRDGLSDQSGPTPVRTPAAIKRKIDRTLQELAKALTFAGRNHTAFEGDFPTGECAGSSWRWAVTCGGWAAPWRTWRRRSPAAMAAAS